MSPENTDPSSETNKDGDKKEEGNKAEEGKEKKEEKEEETTCFTRLGCKPSASTAINIADLTLLPNPGVTEIGTGMKVEKSPGRSYGTSFGCSSEVIFELRYLATTLASKGARSFLRSQVFCLEPTAVRVK